ncbi:MAG: beta-lactamase family protein [Actinobacteria bacterium]|nr:beta-lactamase family protein [Actinomycetota bacterium]
MSTSPDTLAAAFQALVDHEAAVEGAAALLRVELPSQHTVWRHAAGGIERGGAPALPTSPFRVASITKTFTAAVVTQLAAEGRLHFDDLMVQHLPAEYLDLVPRLHVLDGVSHGESITVRQLLTHASGLFDYALSPGFFGTIVADPSHVWTPREMLEGATVWGTPHFPPGGGYGYAYSDTGYVLLGVIIEGLDGRPLHESYRARILEPLGLANTYLEGFEAHRGSAMTHPHEGEFDAAPIHGSADWAGGGLVSDTDDLAAFAQALVAGRVVAEPLLHEMLEYRFRTLDPALHSPGYLGYGFGVEAREVNGFLLRGHRGHWGAWMHVDPVSGLTITGTINQSNRRPDSVVQGVTAAVRRSGLLEVTS